MTLDPPAEDARPSSATPRSSDAVDVLIAANPFPGLRPFDTAEADRFFGRQQQIDELVERLVDVSLLAVTGDSGCGKSSLVRAGVLDRLLGRRDDGDRPLWITAVMRPGDRPLAALARALARALTAAADGPSEADDATAEARMLGRLRVGGLGLVDSVRMARLGPRQRLLLVVDQFEEIFRFELNGDEASAFVKLLLNVALDPYSPVAVILTLRSDALGACATHRGLPEAISRGQYLVPKLTRAQRTEAIVGPVAAVLGPVGPDGERSVAPRLVQRLLNDVSDTYDDLPVLQHVLSRTWARWARDCAGRRAIDLDDYDAVGTSRSAISLHGQEACDDLTHLDRVVERVFRALTERVGEAAGIRGIEGQERRRPLPYDELCRIVGGRADDVARVVERFRRRDTGFLMAGPPLVENPTIDISHESLIRLWDRLREWVEAEQVAAQRLRSLADHASDHRDREGLPLRGRSLDEAIAWRDAQRPTPAWAGLYLGRSGPAMRDEIDRYIDASIAAQDAAKTRQRRRRLALTTVTIAIVAGSLIFGAVGYRLARQAKSRELSSTALRERDRYPARAARLALAAFELDPDNAMADFTLRDALANLEVVRVESILPTPEPIKDLRYSPDRSRLLEIVGNAVRVLDARQFQQIGEAVRRDEDVDEAWLTSDNQTLVTRAGRSVRFQRLGSTEHEDATCPGDDNFPFSVEVSSIASRVAIGCFADQVLVWQAGDGAVRRTHAFAHHRGVGALTITALAFSADGRLLASGDANGVVNVWNLDAPVDPSGRAWIGQRKPDGNDSPMKHGAAIVSLGFHATHPELLISASDDTVATVWRMDLANRRLADDKQRKNRWNLPHTHPPTLARFLPPFDDQNFALTLSGKGAQLWDDETPKRQTRNHEDFVTDIDAAAAAPVFMTAGQDGTARIWSTRTSIPMAVLRGHRYGIKRALFASDDGSRLVTLGVDGQAFVWRHAPPQLMLEREHWVLGASFSPDGRQIAVAEENGGILVPTTVERDARPKEEALSMPLANSAFMTWNRDGSRIAGRSFGAEKFVGGIAVVWDAASHAQIEPKWLKSQSFATFCAACDDLLTIDNDGRLSLWRGADLSNDEARPIARFGDNPSMSMAAVSPDGRWIVAAVGSTILLWSRDHPARPAIVLNAHKGDIRSLTFDRESRWLLSASADRTARIWPLDPQRQGTSVLLEGSGASLYTASFDGAGRHVATGNSEGRIDVWDFDPEHASASRLASLPWHSDGVNTVQFSPDGQQILSASDDGTIRLGRCEVCLMGSRNLHARVEHEAVLPADELAKVRDESAITLRDLGVGRR